MDAAAMPSTPHLAPASACQRIFSRFAVAGWLNDNVHLLVRIRGPLDRSALTETLDELFRRHEVLRTTLGRIDGELHQQIWPFTRPTIRDIHIRQARSLDEHAADETITAELSTPFDHGSAHLSRIGLFRASEKDDHLLAITMDHMIADGGSCRVLYEELLTILAAKLSGTQVELPTPASQYREYVAWEQRFDTERHAAFWRARLAPTKVVFPLEREPGGSGSTLQAQPEICDLEPALVERLSMLAAERRVSEATPHLAAIAAAFSPWAEGPLCVVVVFANRGNRAFGSTVGPIVHFLPLRLSCDPGMTFLDLLDATGKQWIEATLRALPMSAIDQLIDDGDAFTMGDLVINFIGPPPGPTVLEGADGTRLELAPQGLPCGDPRLRLAQDGGEPPPDVATVLATDGSAQISLKLSSQFAPSGRRALIDHINHAVASLARAPHEPIAKALDTGSPLLPKPPLLTRAP
jgi:hypothetical protein